MTTLIWLVLSVFILHDFEEIIVVENWLKKNEKDVLKVLPVRYHSYFNKVFPRNTAGFSVAVLVEYIGILAAVFVAIGWVDSSWSIIGILGVVAILFIHSFTHLGQCVFLKRYTPGVLTAVVLLIPFCLYFYEYFLSHDIITWGMICSSIPIGLVFVAILNQIGLYLGKRIT